MWLLCYVMILRSPTTSNLFFFNDTATTEIYTLSLHDALPISLNSSQTRTLAGTTSLTSTSGAGGGPDRKSTRLNSSHSQISYAVFCLKKKKNQHRRRLTERHVPTVSNVVSCSSAASRRSHNTR